MRKLLALVGLVVLFLGWKFPLLGFMVPVVMLVGMGIAIFKGRYLCGNLCPRGSFLDLLFSKISPKKKIPHILKSMFIRVPILVSLMGLMIYKISIAPTNINYLGQTFWLMCAATTTVALVMAVVLHHRGWCAICPMGTMQNLISRFEVKNTISPDCIKCKTCVKDCPLNLKG